ncbi:MAG: hypothetical protein BWX72_01995 [Firmicutes bacterium ADurb.Bin080]|jgi:hypothetical protein|nr:hypothetical protein [Clostridiales bacterium]OQC12346.1 MAG: hypothetical protein BWX72_01995 [Firmicutes bacterium ADurb.Bin080]
MKIFALDRASIIEDYEDLSILKDLTEGKKFSFSASRHEYFVVQLLLLPDYTTDKLEVQTGPLEGSTKDIIGAVTCFNTEGISFEGENFKKYLSVKKGVLQPLFFGFNFSRSGIGLHSTKIRVGKDDLIIEIDLSDRLVFNEGTDNKTTLSRLKWLNSNIARNISLIDDLDALNIVGKEVRFSGKNIKLGNDGLVDNVESFFNDSNSLEPDIQTTLFYRPMEIVIEGKKLKYNKIRIAGRQNKGILMADGKGDGVKIEIIAVLLYEGAMSYRVKISAEKDVVTSNIALNMYYLSPDFMIGFGKRACAIENYEKKWDSQYNQNSFFLGKVNCGARVKFEGASESKTVVGFYKQCPIEVPESWDNGGLGGIKVEKTENGALFSAYTGRIIMPAKSSKEFFFTLHFTPFKPVNLNKSLALRIGRDQLATTYDKMIERAKNDRLTYLNLTYGGEVNPYLNYPFPYVKAIAALSRTAHKNGLGISVSYNLRDISIQNREIYAYKALGEELILRLKDSTYADSRLSQQLGQDVLLAKVVRYTSGKRKGLNDYAVVTSPRSRMDNYYLEGLNYLVHNANIDAVSMRDANLSRTTIERIKKVIGKKKAFPGIIEMQISDQLNENSGFANSLNYYTDVLPFLDKIWLDRSFEGMPENPETILAECSGILYGTAVVGRENDSISKCLLFAMLPKYGLKYDVSEALGDVYRHLDDFNVSKASFRGFWDSSNPVKTDKSEVKCSSYLCGEDMLAVFYNFSSSVSEFEIGVENKLGFTTMNKKIHTLEISGMQKRKKVNLGKQIVLKPHSGMIILIKA